ncbi:ABC transporter transmembrane region, partial [Teladorsagia circumcincta]
AGEVVEVGTHEELLSNKGLYYDLVHAQTFTDAVDDVNELKAEGVQKTNLFEILGYAAPHWKTIVVGLTACVIGGLVYPTYSVVFMQVITSFSNTATLLSTGHFWALMFLVLAAIQGSTMFMQTFFMGYGAENLTMDLRSKLFSNILSQDMGYFDSSLHACGKICTRLATDVPNLRSAIDFRLSTVIMTCISMIAGIVLAFYYGWQMALLVVGILPLLGFGQALRVRVMSGKHRKNAKDFEDSGKVAMEAIEHVRTVQALTKEEVFHQKFCDYLDAPHRDALRESFIQGIAYGVMYAITISSSTLGFASSYFPEYMKAAFAGGIIFNMLKQKPAIDNLTHDGKKENLSGAVTFKNVKFSYPERPQIEVLKGLSFTAKPGETLALVGPSGCGKSTVVSLIERFYDVKAGQVLLDSHDIRTLNPYHTRSQIAIVSQEPILFDCSISDNIVYGLE